MLERHLEYRHAFQQTLTNSKLSGRRCSFLIESGLILIVFRSSQSKLKRFLMNAPLILIVDDEEQVGMFASIFLNRAGLRTLRASNARSALGLFTEEIDILLTDWAMPDMTGGELAAQLLERKPTLRVLFMSGNVELPMQPGSTLEPGVNFIQKPFVSEDLIALVRQALIQGREPVPAS